MVAFHKHVDDVENFVELFVGDRQGGQQGSLIPSAVLRTITQAVTSNKIPPKDLPPGPNSA